MACPPSLSYLTQTPSMGSSPTGGSGVAAVRGGVDLGHTGQVGQGWAEGQRGLEEGCAAPGRFQLTLLLTKTLFPLRPPTPFSNQG